ncbi:DUF2780 domain-containing protein [Agaribacterium haliotis]|uniref:DUF2780 domain-containing protein n=1 Tax=Agaribacterium haliotis TaxID=2013869 RepID=UPI000BB5377C|nr:DUF2780 domain-containing protein [Agaribacterium haliotis]
MKGIILVVAVAALATACSSHDSKHADSAKDLMGQQGQLVGMDLFDNLSSQLGVSDKQAKGGAGALLALANNKLGDSGMSALAGQLSSGHGSSALSSIDSMDSVYKVFDSLGMDSSMVGKFIPVMTKYFGGKGGSSVAGELAKIWQA